LTLDSACEFLFGESVDSQLTEAGGHPTATNKAHDETAFSRNFDSAQMHMARRFRLSDNYWLYHSQQHKQNNKTVHEFVDYYVRLALSKGTQPKDTEPADEGQKEQYIFLEALAQQTRDPLELRAQLLNILLAGRDTTAPLLSWLFHLLLRHPATFASLRHTIITTFGPYDPDGPPSTDNDRITFTSLKTCQPLQNVLRETLRLWTVVPVNGRRATRATTLPTGGGPQGRDPVYLRAGQQVDYSVHVMHRREDLWGPDADAFRPERFAGRKGNPGWEYLPLNGGPRVCIGRQFALTEAAYVVVRLLQRFDGIWARPEELVGKVRCGYTITNAPGRPVALRLREARGGRIGIAGLVMSVDLRVFGIGCVVLCCYLSSLYGSKSTSSIPCANSIRTCLVSVNAVC